MLKINSISNVNNTLNNANKVNFGAGVQWVKTSATPNKDNMVENGFITGFFGTVSSAFNQIQNRAQSIEKGLSEAKNLDVIA